MRTSYLLMALIVGQWIVISLATKVRASYVVPLLVLAVISWAALGFGLYFWYFA
jgi:hypothetical protein